MNKFFYVIIALISLAIGVIGFRYLSSPLPLPEHTLYYQQPRAVQPFTFIDEDNEEFTQVNFEGNWSFIFLGYTSCPDVCPTTLQNLHFIYEDLTTIATNSQVLFVTADPQRDHIEKLNQYINYFNPSFKALRAEHDVLFPFSRNLGLMYAINSADESDKNYGVDHSGSLVLINPEGKVAAIFKSEHNIGEVPVINNEHLLSDFKKIVDLYE